MRNYDPNACYILLVWCRNCGPSVTLPATDYQAHTIPDLTRRARCSKCRGKSVAMRKEYEPRLSAPGGVHIWELQLIEKALRDAAANARQLSNVALTEGRKELAQRLEGRAGTFARLAENYWREIQDRQATPMHVIP